MPLCAYSLKRASGSRSGSNPSFITHLLKDIYESVRYFNPYNSELNRGLLGWFSDPGLESDY
ncbi:MAG: hypothetical protein ACTSWE_03960 [Promethearchaeota archaeon]